MAKTRKEHSIVSAISAVTAALRLESIPNPTDAQLRQIHDAKVTAADVVDGSNFVALGENADEVIEAMIMAEEEAEARERDLETADERAEAEAEAEEDGF